jgi:hypothetical protein
MYKIANEEAPDIRIVRPDIPEQLAAVVAIAVAKRPETRYQDGDQFAVDLRAAMPDAFPAGGSASSGGAARPAPAAPAASSTTAPAPAEKTVVMGAVTGASYHPAASGGPEGGDAFAKTTMIRKPDGAEGDGI